MGGEVWGLRYWGWDIGGVEVWGMRYGFHSVWLLS